MLWGGCPPLLCTPSLTNIDTLYCWSFLNTIRLSKAPKSISIFKNPLKISKFPIIPSKGSLQTCLYVHKNIYILNKWKLFHFWLMGFIRKSNSTKNISNTKKLNIFEKISIKHKIVKIPKHYKIFTPLKKLLKIKQQLLSGMRKFSRKGNKWNITKGIN